MKTSKTNARRKYRKRRRAALEEDTRRRITEALVELHGSVGPARTTVSAVAEVAGVQRATVYRHFPDEPSMLAACSAHWARQNPFPDPSRWVEIEEPGRRLRTALSEMYEFFARNEAMLSNTTRDEPLVEALRPSMEAFRSYLRAAGDALAGGMPAAGAPARRARAAIGHALSFTTWRSLVREQSLDQEDAVDLMLRFVEAAG